MKENMSFEEALEKLDDIVRRLETGSVSLEDSLSLFEEGIVIIKHCNKKLEGAEQKVRILTENSDGTVSDSSFVSEDDEN